MASAMRLMHPVVAAVEPRRNFCNSNLQDSNSNEANFDGSTIWDAIRAEPPLISEGKLLDANAPPTDSVDWQTRKVLLDNEGLHRLPLGTRSNRSQHVNISAHGRTCNGNESESGSSDDDAPVSGKYRSFQDEASYSSLSSPGSSSGSSLGASSPWPASEGGIVNPNYPGFEHLAAKLLKLAAGSDGEDDDEEANNNKNYNYSTNNYKLINNNINNNDVDRVNQLSAVSDSKQELYKPKLSATMADAFLSSAKEDLTISCDFLRKQAKAQALDQLAHAQSGKALDHLAHAQSGKVFDKLAHAQSGKALDQLAHAQSGKALDHLAHAQSGKVFDKMAHAQSRPSSIKQSALGHHMTHYKDSNRAQEEMEEEEEKFNKEATEKELDDCIVPRKKEKMAMNQQMRKGRALVHPGHPGGSLAASGHKKRSSLEILGGFDVYNIETAMPRIDLDLIESHLRAAKEEERRRRNDREEIRRRLAMGAEDADFYSNESRPGKKPSLQSRLQSGMNLQICFMNETLSDTESPGSESEVAAAGPVLNKAPIHSTVHTSERLPCVNSASKPTRPLSLPLRLDAEQDWRERSSPMTEADFLARQAQLQAEARMALAQAKDMAHMQMELERQRQNASPITEMVRHTLQKVGVSFPEDRRRLSRQILTEMNVAQLQVIVNDLHTQIEYLNESLVRFLMERDDLHMEQDSMLVDIEDLTRYLGAKEQSGKVGQTQSNNNNLMKVIGTATGRENLKK